MAANNWIAVSTGNWSNSANWSLGRVPTTTDVATFTSANNTNCTIDINNTNTTATSVVSVTSGYTGTITVNNGITLSGAGTLLLAGACTFIVNGTMTFTSATTISAAATITINSTTAFSLSSSALTFTTGSNGAILNGTGTIQRPVIISDATVTLGSGTIGTAGTGSGPTFATNQSTAITVQTSGVAVILGATCQTGPGKNDIGIEISGSSALVQDCDLRGININPNTSVSNPYYGIVAISGGEIDAGQVGGTKFATLPGISAGNNLLSGYQNYTGTTLPATLTHPVSQSIIDDDTTHPGSHGVPFDLMAQNNKFGTALLAAVELMVWHFTDNAAQNFCNFSNPIPPPMPPAIAFLQAVKRAAYYCLAFFKVLLP